MLWCGSIISLKIQVCIHCNPMPPYLPLSLDRLYAMWIDIVFPRAQLNVFINDIFNVLNLLPDT